MKPALTLTEQLNLLQSRNLIFKNEYETENILYQHNYYRLSGYWRKFQTDPKNGKDKFKDGTTFEEILEIYNLDSQLRNLLSKGIGIFEVCFRSNFVYWMSHSEKNGMYSYLCLDSYDNRIFKNEKLDDLLIKINRELNTSKEMCIEHYKKREESIPVWAASEVLGFGTISKMYSRWKNRDVVKKVYREFEVFRHIGDYDNIFTVIRALVHLRNLCSHQARIWNKRVVAQVLDRNYLKKFGSSSERAQWKIISVLMLLVDNINKNDEYSKEVLNLCKSNDEFYRGLTEPNL